MRLEDNFPGDGQNWSDREEKTWADGLQKERVACAHEVTTEGTAVFEAHITAQNESRNNQLSSKRRTGLNN